MEGDITFIQILAFGQSNNTDNNKGEESMQSITADDISKAIAQFLTEQFTKKAEPVEKALVAAKTAGDSEKVMKKQEELASIKQKYTAEVWIADAANRMAKQLTFGTHISKGIHPDSKGDNVNFRQSKTLPEGIVGSQSLSKLPLDANGNAAALPLAAFFDISIKADMDIRLRDLIQEQHPAIKLAFSKNAEIDQQYADSFRAALDNPLTTPTSHERNKQLLWPLKGVIDGSMDGEKVAEDHYQCLIPLYPSALTNVFSQKLYQARYSEANKMARDNRKKKTAEQNVYVSIPDIAVIKLGGTKPQNISQLTSSQGGRNYLLPSLPPVYSSKTSFFIRKEQTSIFTDRLSFECRQGFRALKAAINVEQNNYLIRANRKDALDIILATVLSIAAQNQRQYPAGWSKDYALDWSEKLWLDPHRETLEEEHEFAKDRETMDWEQDIERKFATWMHNVLRKKFKKTANDFNDAEYSEWIREIRDMVKAEQRSGKTNKQGVYL